MEITGLLKVKGDVENLTKKDGTAVVGKNGLVSKMGFLIHQAGQYGKDVWVETFSAAVISFLTDTSLETELTCKVDVSSREYNGRYFTSVSCFSVTADKNVSYENKRPFNEPPKGDIGSGSGDDDQLPF